MILQDRRPLGSAPPAETVVRTARGTSHESGQGDIQSHTMSGVNVDAGTWLLVGLVYDHDSDPGGIAVSGVSLAGVPLAQLATQLYADDYRQLTMFGAYFADAVTNGSLTANFSPGYVSAVGMVATQVAGLVTSSALDRTATDAGGGTTPSSGATATPSQAHEFVWGLVGTDGPPADDAGTWTNNLSNGQRVGEACGSFSVTISEGYRVATAQEAQTASKTGITSRAWGAICATFKAAA